MSAAEIVTKVWNYAHVLHDVPVSLPSAQVRGDYSKVMIHA